MDGTRRHRPAVDAQLGTGRATGGCAEALEMRQAPGERVRSWVPARPPRGHARTGSRRLTTRSSGIVDAVEAPAPSNQAGRGRRARRRHGSPGVRAVKLAHVVGTRVHGQSSSSTVGVLLWTCWSLTGARRAGDLIAVGTVAPGRRDGPCPGQGTSARRSRGAYGRLRTVIVGIVDEVEGWPRGRSWGRTVRAASTSIRPPCPRGYRSVSARHRRQRRPAK